MVRKTKPKKQKKRNAKTKPKFKIKDKHIKLFLILLALFVGFTTWAFWDIPLPNQIDDQEQVSTKIFDRNEKLIYEIFADERRTPIGLDEIPEHFKQATISIEDKDFYSHLGFSITGISRAAYKSLTGQRLEGGSTLTQQLVKNTLLTPERTIRRKIREFALALLVEASFSKNEILELYINQIPYGGTAYGVEAASELYFNKPAKDLDLAESALLAGLPQAPSRYSPFGSQPENSKGRQESVLRRMVEDGYITQEESDQAFAEKLEFATPEAPSSPHFALWIKEQLAEKYGEAVVEKGGLRVKTTLDLELQQFAEQTVKEEVGRLASRKVGNGAALVIRPQTGEILAMVGSKDYFAEDEDGKVNVIFSKRQPGSSIKPLNYALGIQTKKITASTPLADVPTCFVVSGQPQYCPVNYDGKFHGATQTRFALGNSYNIPAVRVLALNGLEEFVNFANQMGISTFQDPDQYGLSLTLGGGEVRPYDMAVAFAAIANKGEKVQPIAFLEISDWRGNELFKRDVEKETSIRVVDAQAAFIISHIMLDNNARTNAFGPSSYLNVAGHPEVSVKTGTTNDLRDNWTIGFTQDAVVVTWVGNNDNSPMSGAISGVSGASPIWNKIMKETLNKYEEDGHAWAKQPDGIVGASVCANTGSLPNEATSDCPQRFEYFYEGTVPEGNAFKQDIFVFNDTGAMANEEALPEQIHTETHLMTKDPLDTLICLDCGGHVSTSRISI